MFENYYSQENDPTHTVFFLILLSQIDGYAHFSTGGCKGRNELGATTGGSVQECANSCTNDSTCVSFEYGKTGDPNNNWYRKCSRSTSCNDYNLTVQDESDPAHFYLKNMVSICVRLLLSFKVNSS